MKFGTLTSHQVINKLVVYKCKSCDNLLKKTKCSSEVKDVPYCRICQKDMIVSTDRTPINSDEDDLGNFAEDIDGMMSKMKIDEN